MSVVMFRGFLIFFQAIFSIQLFIDLENNYPPRSKKYTVWMPYPKLHLYLLQKSIYLFLERRKFINGWLCMSSLPQESRNPPPPDYRGTSTCHAHSKHESQDSWAFPFQSRGIKPSKPRYGVALEKVPSPVQFYSEETQKHSNTASQRAVSASMAWCS